MVKSFKKRWKIVQDEILNEEWNRIYSEANIKKLIKKRYNKWEIKTDNSYIYKKMKDLLNKKVYMEIRNMPKKFVSGCGYVNVFELHKMLTEIIEVRHIPEIDSKRYTKEEKKYMELMKNKRI